MAEWVAAVAAAFGTGVWAICLAESGHNKFDEVRFALIGAGIMCAVSMAVIPPCTTPTERSAGLAFILAAYQALIYSAVSRGGAAMQAIINCNIVVVCIHRHVFVTPADSPSTLAAAAIAAAASAAVVALNG